MPVKYVVTTEFLTQIRNNLKGLIVAGQNFAKPVKNKGRFRNRLSSSQQPVPNSGPQLFQSILQKVHVLYVSMRGSNNSMVLFDQQVLMRPSTSPEKGAHG
jgi:hypothetical protein